MAEKTRRCTKTANKNFIKLCKSTKCSMTHYQDSDNENYLKAYAPT